MLSTPIHTAKVFLSTLIIIAVSACGSVVPSNFALKVMAATSTSATSVKVVFSDSVGAEGQNPANFFIENLSVVAANANGNTVTLTTAEQSAANYTVTISNIWSEGGKPLAADADTASFQGTPANPVPSPDTVAPELKWLEPGDGGSSFEGADITLKVSATDNVAVAQVSFYVNGDPVSTVEVAPYETLWSSAGREAGSYTLSAIARDAAGNETMQTIRHEITEDKTPTKDMTPPTVSWLEPTNGASFDVGSNILFKVNAEDNEELESVSFYVNDQLLEKDDDEAYETRWSTAGLAGGTYTLKAVAVDEAGNEAEQNVTVTLKVPVVNTAYSDGTVNVNYSGRDFQTYFDNRIAARYQPTSISGHGASSNLFAASWKASTNGWYSYYGMTATQYQQRFDSLKAQGYRLTYIDGYTVGGQTRFAAIWEKVSGPAWIALHNMNSAQYQQVFNTYKTIGFRPVHVSGYEINGQAYYAAIWEKSSGMTWATRHGMTSAQYQSFATEYVKKGYRITQVSGYSVAGQARFAAIMEKSSGPTWIARHGMTTKRFKELHESYKRSGYRIVQLDGYMQGDATRFAAIWHK